MHPNPRLHWARKRGVCVGFFLRPGQAEPRAKTKSGLEEARKGFRACGLGAGSPLPAPPESSPRARVAAIFAAADPGERFFGYFLVATRKYLVRRDETRLIYLSP
ncbi:MAG: hypothetical protein BMS9Abin10_0708 [Gammaproteobacteria bacterium]|nr:MAG: hypothetical protein BMS9Abin10_0708 [Gammaproteobacteria bacterium]